MQSDTNLELRQEYFVILCTGSDLLDGQMHRRYRVEDCFRRLRVTLTFLPPW